MPCIIINGREIDCRDSVGGVAEIYLTEFANVPQANITASSGVITAATCASGKRFFTYQLEKENAQFTPKWMPSVENQSLYCEQTLTFTTAKMTAATRNTMKLLVQNRLHVIVKDNNGVYWWMGQVNAADVTGLDGDTGKAMGDRNGFTLTFTAKEPDWPNTISAALVASLQIGS